MLDGGKEIDSDQSAIQLDVGKEERGEELENKKEIE